MTSFRLRVVVLLTAVMTAAACGAGDSVDTAARVGSQELTAARLAEVLSASQAPVETETARSIAELWVNYQLAGLAAARGDSLSDTATMHAGLWSVIDNMRVRRLYEEVSKSWTLDSTVTADALYASGELMSARHILVQVGQDGTPDMVEAQRKKAEAIRAEVTPTNFARLATRSDEPGAGDRGGDLGIFTRGTMVPDFENAVLALQPGEISPIVRTAFGFHVIYRKPYSEVRDEVETQANQRRAARAESTYLADLETASQVKVANDAAGRTKEIARNPLGFREDNSALAEYRGGKLTAARLADWISASPPQVQIRAQLVSAADSLADRFVRQIVRNELLFRLADSAAIEVDPEELTNLRMAFRNNLTMAWTTMGVEPSTLSDSATSQAQRDALAASRIESYFAKLVKNEAQFADVAYPVARALQTRYDFSLNDAGLERAVEQARQLRSASDSAAPPTPGLSAPPVLDSGATGVIPPSR